MVRLVDDDVVVVISGQLGVQGLRVQGLHRNEQMIQRFRLVVAHVKLAEVGVLQHTGEGITALFEDFFAVGNEQKSVRLADILLAEAFVVQRGNHGLAGAGGGNHQIPVQAAHLTFRQQSIENLLLIRVRTDVKQELQTISLILLSLQGLVQAVALVLIVKFKLIGMPVSIKGSRNLADRLGQIAGGCLHVPFQTAGNSGVGQVGRSHIGRRKASITVENIGLGMQTGALGIVGDFDLRIRQRRKLLDGLDIRCSHVRCGDDPQLAATLREIR